MDKLTTKAIDALPSKDRDYTVFDPTVPGFAVRVMPSGVKTYVYRYKIGRMQRYVTIGRHGMLKLDSAKDKARDLYAKIRDGGDPAMERKSKGNTMTIADLYDEFWKHYVAEFKAQKGYEISEGTIVNWKLTRDKYIVPMVGKLLIGRGAIEDKLHDVFLTMTDKPAAANQFRMILSKMFNYAVKRRYVDRNPITFGKMAPKNPPPGASMSPEEAAAVYLACEQWAENAKAEGRTQWKIGYGFQMLIVAGSRKSELMFNAKWEFVHKDRIEIPFMLVKTRKPYVCVRTDLVDSILDKVADRSDGYIFGNNGQRVPNGVDTKYWKEIEALAGLTRHYRIHDIRHTFASLIEEETTLNTKQLQSLMNHSRIATTERYIHRSLRGKKMAANAATEQLKALLAVPKEIASA